MPTEEQVASAYYVDGMERMSVDEYRKALQIKLRGFEAPRSDDSPQQAPKASTVRACALRTRMCV